VIYKGFRVEKFEGQTATSTSYGREKGRFDAGKGQSYSDSRTRFKKVAGYYVEYPDGGSKFCSSLKEAKRYIDAYLGDV